MADWQKKDKDKVIHVNTSALVGLKAALYSKQKEFAREKKLLFENELSKTRQVSEKTSSIWKKAEPPGRKGRTVGKMGGASQEERTEEKELSHEEEAALERSRRALEVKSALYDRLSKGEGLKELEEEEEAGLGEGHQRYMVDFTRKIVESQTDASNQHPQTTPTSDMPTTATASSIEGEGRPIATDNQDNSAPERGKEEEEEEEGDWVVYVDSLGRSRRCLREDLEEMKSRDRDLRSSPPVSSSQQYKQRPVTPEDLSEDMSGRERWAPDRDEDGEGDLDGPAEPVHYQSVQGGEVRHHGVGYYAFSTDMEKRKEQMELLTNLREKTFAQREKRQQLQEKRKSLLDARLAKVKQRRMKKLQEQGGVASGEVVGDSKEEGAAEDLADFNFDTTENKQGDAVKDGGGGVASEVSALLAVELKRAQEKAERDDEEKKERIRTSHVRPWDKGKVVDPIKKRKRELEDERLDEFAPPSSYSKSGSGPQRQLFVRAAQSAPEASPAPDSTHCSTSSPSDQPPVPTAQSKPLPENQTNPPVVDNTITHLLPPPPPPIHWHPLYPTMPLFGVPPPPPPYVMVTPPLATPSPYGYPVQSAYGYPVQSAYGYPVQSAYGYQDLAPPVTVAAATCRDSDTSLPPTSDPMI